MPKEIQYILGELLKAKKKTLSIAESCTGGFISNLVTNVPGSSVYFTGGVVSYTNKAKTDILKVPPKIIEEEGAVSRECAIRMAKNVRNVFGSDIGLGLTGILGPGGATPKTPAGSVYIAVDSGEKTICKLYRFNGTRQEIKQYAGETALKLVRDMVS